MNVTFAQQPPAMLDKIVVQLGRIGDILNIIPACAALGLQHIVVGQQFQELFSGFSYLRPHLWGGDLEDLAGAVQAAQGIANQVLVPQLFGLRQPPGLPPRTRPSFVMDQWDRLQPGFGDKWGTLPLIVDTRVVHEIRCMEERAVRCSNYRMNRRMLVVSLDGISGPYPHAEELRRHLRHRWADKFDIVDLHRRLPRFLDILGLYGSGQQNVAAGLIAIDSAPLHLARAVPSLPVFQLLRPGPDGTPPIGPQATCQLYDCCDWGQLDAWLESLAAGVMFDREAA